MVQWLKLHPPMQGVWIQSLVRELKPHMLFSQKRKKKKKKNPQSRENIVTDSIKT